MTPEAPGAPAALAEEESPEPPALEAGDQVTPGYEVIDHLSRGNALDVYDVWSEERTCRCVAKVLRPDRLDHQRTRERLLQEGRLLCAFSHPHIVRAYETIEEPYPVVILETLVGETLSHLIHRRSRRLSVPELAFLGLHLCSAMSYLHRRGFLHRDLKPSNIVSDRGLAKVLDLSLTAPTGVHRAGAGTHAYMAPEQARGGYLDTPIDVWGIGVVLHAAARGDGPFDFEGDEGAYLQLEHRADAIRRHRRLPVAFAAVLDACLDPAPERRPAVEELAVTLESCAPHPRRGLPPDE
jgi:serine/threonine protein kinase